MSWWKIVAIAISVGVGFSAGWYFKPAQAPSDRYSFRVSLVDPNPGGTFQQPTALNLPRAFDDKQFDSPPGQQSSPPPGGTIQTIDVVLGRPGPHEHPEADPDSDPGNHCHAWIRIVNTWYQVHCGR